MDNYPIITMIGSSRFKEEYEKEAKKLTLNGALVIPLIFYRENKNDFDTAIKNSEILKEICNKKIEIADIVFVVNKDGYIGKRTQESIEYAESLNKPVWYMEWYSKVETLEKPLIDPNRLVYELCNIADRDKESLISQCCKEAADCITQLFSDVNYLRRFHTGVL